MKLTLQLIVLSVLSFLFVIPTYADEHQSAIDDCIGVWPNAPFKKGTAANKIMSIGVKVFGIGKEDGGDMTATTTPSLVLVRPAVNVLGKSTIRLMNPNGWYCLETNVSVLGKVDIQAHCNAHIASSHDGTAVLAADDSEGGVSVLGSIRIARVGCDKK